MTCKMLYAKLTWVDFEQNVIEAAIDQWRERLSSCVRGCGGHFEYML